MLSSSIPNPIPPFGSDVTLTCAVELSQAVDVPVTVNTVLTTDEGFTRTSTAQPVIGIITNYTSIFMIRLFGRSDSRIYTCSATVSLPSNAYISNSSTVHHSVRVTTGEMFTIIVLHESQLLVYISQVSILHWEVYTLLTIATLISKALVYLLTIPMVLYSASLTILAAAVGLTLHLGSGTNQMEH